MLTEEEMKVISDLHYLLDLSGFSRMTAYAVLGTTPSGIGKLKNMERRKLRLDTVALLTDALRSELQTGNYPACVETAGAKQIKQLTNILSNKIKR